MRSHSASVSARWIGGSGGTTPTRQPLCCCQRTAGGVTAGGNRLVRPAPVRPCQPEGAARLVSRHRQDQAARFRHGERDQAGSSAPFFHGLLAPGGVAHHDQEGMCQQAERHEAVPCRPGAHLVLIHAHLPFRLREAFLDLPARVAHPHQLLLGRPRRAVGEPVRIRARIVRIATDEQPAPHARSHIPRESARHSQRRGVRRGESARPVAPRGCVARR